MKTIFNFFAGVFMIAGFYGFMFLFGEIWDDRLRYEFVIGALSLLGWLAIGVLIVVWICRLAYPKK